MQIEKIESAPAHMAGYSSDSDYRINRGQRQAEADAQTLKAFAEACRNGDANAPATWAPSVPDYSDFGARKHERRTPLLHEVMSEALDFSDGPQMSELMQLLLNVANGLPGAQDQARALLASMVSEWVKHCGPEVTE